MSATSKGNSAARGIYTIIVLACASIIAACGGSGGDSPRLDTGSGGSGSQSSSSAGSTVSAAAILFKSAVPSDKSIVIKGAGGNGRTEIALLTFTVVDAKNVGLAGQKVSFVSNSSQPVTLASPGGVTDSSGNVVVALSSGSDPTTVRVTASVDNTNLSVISDSIRVTTGQPVQAALSVSLEKFAIEGLDFDNVKQKVTVLLADAFGGAVADGTPVVFTTDSGAIVGTGGSGCTTTSGECSVDWRSQAPRPSNGIATIIATATNGTEKLSTAVQFYVSGSTATVYERSGDLRFASLSSYLFPNGSPTATCDPQSTQIEVVDSSGNPMPTGTTLSATSSMGSATFLPATVGDRLWPSIGSGSTTRGTVHTMTITPTGCTITGTTRKKTDNLYITVTTPKGVVTLVPVRVTVAIPAT